MKFCIEDAAEALDGPAVVGRLVEVQARHRDVAFYVISD